MFDTLKREMSLRSKVLAYFLDTKNSPNADIFEAVDSIVRSDIECAQEFKRADDASVVLNIAHQLISLGSKLLTPETKACETPLPEIPHDTTTQNLLYTHVATRTQLVDSFFESQNEHSSPLVRLYCEADLRSEQSAGWKGFQTKSLALISQVAQWYFAVIAKAMYPKKHHCHDNELRPMTAEDIKELARKLSAEENGGIAQEMYPKHAHKHEQHCPEDVCDERTGFYVHPSTFPTEENGGIRPMTAQDLDELARKISGTDSKLYDDMSTQGVDDLMKQPPLDARFQSHEDMQDYHYPSFTCETQCVNGTCTPQEQDAHKFDCFPSSFSATSFTTTTNTTDTPQAQVPTPATLPEWDATPEASSSSSTCY
jgi:hypothetical protein